MFRKKLRKSDLFTRCFLKVNTLLTMWSNCVHLSFIHFLLMLLFRLRLLESIARNVHKNDQINMYIYRRLFNDFDHAHTSFPICKMRFSFLFFFFLITGANNFYSVYYRKIWSMNDYSLFFSKIDRLFLIELN